MEESEPSILRKPTAAFWSFGLVRWMEARRMMRASGWQPGTEALKLVRKDVSSLGSAGSVTSLRVRASAASGSLAAQMASSTRKRGMR